MTNPSLQIGNNNWAYKEDSLLGYAISPINSGFLPREMTFTRASSGTRINENGQVELVSWNLADYSEELNNAVYVVRSGVTITDNATTAPNGTSTADLMYISSSGDYRYTAQTFTQPQNIYTISVYVKAQNKNVIWMYMENSGLYGLIYFDLSDGTMQTTAGATSTPSGTITAVGNGWYRCTFTLGQSIALATGSGIGVCDAKGSVYGTASGTNGVYVWGFQVNIGSTAKPYLATTDRLNIPRVTYSNGSGALLLEKQSTNLLVYSEQFNQWITNGTTTANVAISPDGTQNADRLNFTSGSIYWLDGAVSATNGQQYTYSLYVKPTAIGDQFRFYIDGAFNVSTVITTDSSDWKRYEYTFTASATGSINPHILLGYGYNSQSMLVWGAQLEASSYATSYIPTTSTSSTRIADACYKTGISNYIGQTEGVMYWDIEVETLSATGNENILNIDNGSFGNTIYLIKGGTGSLTAEIYVSSIAQCSFTYSLPSVGRYKVALAYKANDFAFYVNGVQRGTDSSGSVPATSRLQLGNGALGPSDGKTYGVQLYTTRLSNSELASLTTI